MSSTYNCTTKHEHPLMKSVPLVKSVASIIAFATRSLGWRSPILWTSAPEHSETRVVEQPSSSLYDLGGLQWEHPSDEARPIRRRNRLKRPCSLNSWVRWKMTSLCDLSTHWQECGWYKHPCLLMSAVHGPNWVLYPSRSIHLSCLINIMNSKTPT